MSKLTVTQNGITGKVEFTGARKLDELLDEGGFLCNKPCGGIGKCGKCAVELWGDVSEPNANELKAGARLSCQAIVYGDASVILKDTSNGEQIETDALGDMGELIPMEGDLGAAVDIGTTTVALKLYDLIKGVELASSAMLNPQGTVSADVMGRIGAAMDGRHAELKELIWNCLDSLLGEACREAGVIPARVTSMVITGNTTMFYLLCGRDPVSISRFPFVSDTLFDENIDFLGRKAYLPPCMNAFVGADITCAVLFSGMIDEGGTSLLCDIGTNGEMALIKDGRLYVTSTAAGPAFEGAGISCGCGSITGAIDSVMAEDGQLVIHTIGGTKAVGICGSGLIDAVAACLDLELIDETGAMDDDEISLADGVYLSDKDIRSVQLAKAAIAAGIDTLLEKAGATYDDIDTLYIAGGFGSHLNTESAGRIGLIPKPLLPKIKVIGNAALAGASKLLLNTPSIEKVRVIAASSAHINLGGDALFNELYIENMLFE